MEWPIATAPRPNWFNKHLLEIEETISMLENCYKQLMAFNPELKIHFYGKSGAAYQGWGGGE